MEYQHLTKEKIQQEMELHFGRSSTRRINLYTGPYGADLFEEEMDKYGGLKRLYVGKKPMRLIRNLYKLKKSHSGRWFHYVKTEPKKLFP